MLLLFTATGAGPAPTLPLPPVPPEHPPTEQTAPIPNHGCPWAARHRFSRNAVQITDFRVPRRDASKGYTPGSHFQSSSERRDIDTPGLTVRVPLQ